MAENAGASPGAAPERRPRRADGERRRRPARPVGRADGAAGNSGFAVAASAPGGAVAIPAPWPGWVARGSVSTGPPGQPPPASAFIRRALRQPLLPAPDDLSHRAADVVSAGAMGFVIMLMAITDTEHPPAAGLPRRGFHGTAWTGCRQGCSLERSCCRPSPKP